MRRAMRGEALRFTEGLRSKVDPLRAHSNMVVWKESCQVCPPKHQLWLLVRKLSDRGHEAFLTRRTMISARTQNLRCTMRTQ